jgi:hypothetical protein
MNGEEIIVKDSNIQYGVKRLHVIRMRVPVDARKCVVERKQSGKADMAI